MTLSSLSTLRKSADTQLRRPAAERTGTEAPRPAPVRAEARPTGTADSFSARGSTSPSAGQTARSASAAPVQARALWGEERTSGPSAAARAEQSGAVESGPHVVAPSPRGGMGAIPFDGGTTFRVWAPNARRVQVVGDFNGWDVNKAVDLWREDGTGNWSADVPFAEHGQKYKFVIEGKYGDWRWRNDPRSQDVTNSTGDSVIYDHSKYHWKHDGNFKMPSWDEAVIYEMHVGTFHDEPGWGPGNWESAIAKLDHLKDLGINVIKMMPTAEFAADFSWGYNPAYPFAPESAYGSPDDLKRFVDEAHARGIGVVMDVVYNHLGPSDLPMWDFDGETHGNGGEYFYTDWRSKTPWGNTRPDFGRHEVREYIRDSAMMWLRDYHMDGLRFDATSEIRNHSGQVNPDGWSLLKDINDAVNREFPWKLVIAEDMQNDPGLTHQNGANFDSQWDSKFVHTIRDEVKKYSDHDRDMFRIADIIDDNYNGQGTQRVIFSESHDEAANGKQRLNSEIGGWDSNGYHARKKAFMATALALTSPGIPMIFQGQEFMENGHFSDTDPLDWSHAAGNTGTQAMHGDLIRLRRNWNNNTRGLTGENVNVFHVNNNDKVVGFHRWDQGGNGDDVIVLANFSGRTFHDYKVGLPSDGHWKVRYNSDWKGYGHDFGAVDVNDMGGRWEGKDGMPASGTINLPPYSFVILSKDR